MHVVKDSFKSGRDFLFHVWPFTIIAVIGALFLAFYLFASPATVIAPDYTDLIIHLDFDNDTGNAVVDSSLYQHNGTASGTVIAPGKFGNGRSFNGVSDYIVIPHTAALMPTSAITVEAWVYLDDVNQSGRIIQKRNISEGGGYVLGVYDNPKGHALEIYHADILEASRTGSDLIANTWQHIAATFDGSAVKIYENGVLKGTKSYSGSITAASTDLIIGGVQQTLNLPFKGKIDEVRIYKRALSEAEVQCSYEGKMWSYDEGCQTTISKTTMIVSVDGPTALAVGELGTWTVRSHDPNGDTVSYRVDWRDGTIDSITSTSAGNNRTQTLTHTYTTAGTYGPSFSGMDQVRIGSSKTMTVPVIVSAPVDTTPPSPPSSLTVLSFGSTAAQLQWTAPSDNVAVTRYDIRYRQGFSVAEVDWSSATAATNPPTPATSGTVQEYVLSSITPNTDYAVGIKSCDAASNCSTIATVWFKTASGAVYGGGGGPIPSGSGSIAVRTLRSDGVVLPFAAYASIRYVVNDSKREMILGADGRYTFTNLGPGLYDLATWWSTVAGYTAPPLITVVVGTGQTTHDFTVQAPAGTGGTTGSTADTQQPSTPSLVTGVVGATTVNLQVVVPQDNVGVTRMPIRRRVGATITESDWAGATQITEILTSGQVAGTFLPTTLTGFSENTPYTIGIKACDAAGNCSGIASWGFQTESRTTGTAADTQAPSTPTGLTVSSTTSSSATMRWIAPLDDIGVTRYHMRYQVGSAIGEADWAGASAPAEPPPIPAASGIIQEITISNLTANTQYAFGIKACDATGNCSGIASVTFRTSASTVSTPATPATPAVSATPATPAAPSSSGGGGGGGSSSAQPVTPAAPATPATPAVPATAPTVSVGAQPVVPVTSGLVLERRPSVVDANSVAINETAKLITQDKYAAILVELNQLRSIVKEQQTQIQYLQSLQKDVAVLSDKVEQVVINFIAYGVDTNTQKLGEGERAAVLHSYKSAFGKLPESETEVEDAVKIANGRFPEARSSDAEQSAAERFEKIYKRNPNVENQNDSAAIAVMAYGLRQRAENRNLISERVALHTFQDIYHKNPQSTEDWNILQAITYSGAKR